MVKRVTQYVNGFGQPIYSENGEFYSRQNNRAPWRRLPNYAHYHVWWEANNRNHANLNLNIVGYIANLKAEYNWAARIIQKIERGRASRKRTAFKRSIFDRLPNNLRRNIFVRQ